MAAQRRWTRSLQLLRLFGVGSVGVGQEVDTVMGLPLPSELALWGSMPDELLSSALGMAAKVGCTPTHPYKSAFFTH